MWIASLLVVLGVLSRLLPHPPNAVALGAIALYAGARLPRRWALAVPLTVMIASDLVLDLTLPYTLDPATRLTGYATFGLIVFMGRLQWRRTEPLRLAGLSVSASLLFFLTSNFAVWATGSGFSYPQTLTGLIDTYAAGIPFLGNSLAADLLGTAVLFGLDALLAPNRVDVPATAEK